MLPALDLSGYLSIKAWATMNALDVEVLQGTGDVVPCAHVNLSDDDREQCIAISMSKPFTKGKNINYSKMESSILYFGVVP